ncbi:hypothetical protein [uncultured Sphingomonas sp.]|uniref:hypothetical protein n=1 Tax=uncultured Sphingomonas sp. TaxID=158754 RepID=UPI0035CB9EB9
MAKLKVYRTPIGFHDAYVAAPSRKAALQAWGSDADLFARGMAEVVDDPALAAEPLAHPGEVIRRSRGSAAEQLAALPPDRPRPKAAKPTEPTARRPRAKPPRPRRDALDAAEQALADAEARQSAEDKALAAEEAELRRRRERARADHAATIERLEKARLQAERGYAEALARWQAAD